MRNGGEVNQGLSEDQQKRVIALIDLQPALLKILGLGKRLGDFNEFDMMLFTEGLCNELGEKQGKQLAPLFAQLVTWMDASPEDRLTTLEQTEEVLKELIKNTAVIRLAAKLGEDAFVKMALKDFTTEQFRALMQEELGMWEHDPLKGVVAPSGDGKHAPSVPAIQCLLAQAPSTIDRDPEGLIFHAMEQFRLRHVIGKSIGAANETQIIKLLLEIPVPKDKPTTLNNLHYYKRFPGIAMSLGYLEMANRETKVNDPLPLEYEEWTPRNGAAADGVNATDVTPEGLPSRRRPHNQYTVLMIAGLYKMDGIVELLITDPRIEPLVTTKIKWKNKDSITSTIYCESEGWQAVRGGYRNAYYSGVGTPSNSALTNNASELVNSIRLDDDDADYLTWLESKEHGPVGELLRQAVVNAFCEKANKMKPGQLADVKNMAKALGIDPKRAIECLFEMAKLKAERKTNPLEKIEVLSHVLDDVSNNSGLTIFIGEKLLKKLQENLVDHIQSESAKIPTAAPSTHSTLLVNQKGPAGAGKIQQEQQDTANVTDPMPKPGHDPR